MKAPLKNLRSFGAIIALTLSTVGLAQTQVFTDSFDGTLTTLSSDSFAWYSRDGAWSYVSGELRYGTAERAAVGYFVNPGAHLSLVNVGDSISLQVNFLIDNGNQTGADRFRIALLGSGTTPITANWSGSNSTANAAGSTGIIATVGQLRGSTAGGSVTADSLRLYDRATASTLVMGDTSSMTAYTLSTSR